MNSKANFESLDFLTILDVCTDAAYKAVTIPVYYVLSETKDELNIMANNLKNITGLKCIDVGDFPSIYLNALRNNAEKDLIQNMIDTGVLFLENFHFCAGKEVTQRELLNILNERIENRRITFVFSEIDVLSHQSYFEEIKQIVGDARKFIVSS